jgi:drug/metabolite transporter (DMT)-like permease
MAAALVGVTLATRTPDAPGWGAGSRQGLELAAVAALGFGGFYVGMDAAVDEVEPLWALLAARLSAGAALAAVLLVVRPRLEASAADLPSLALIGLLDVGANGCFALGVETGLVSVVAVLASLYPVGTVLLARALLGERLVAVQTVGVAFALTGVALIAAASA